MTHSQSVQCCCCCLWRRTTSFKKLLEYLFWIYDPELPGGANELERILEEGFMDPDTLKVRSWRSFKSR